jgi:DNA-binding XRE family transcriptional regulator
MQTNGIRLSLAAARVNAGLTQEEVAKTLQISKSTVVNWEKEKVKPSFASLSALSNLYGLPIDVFKIFCPDDSLKVNAQNGNESGASTDTAD